MITLLAILLVLLMAGMAINDGWPSIETVGGSVSAAALDALTKTVTLTTPSTTYAVDSVAIQQYAHARWQLTLTKGTAKRAVLVCGQHDGSSSSAATNVTWTTEGPGPVGTVDVSIACALSGSGSGQVLQLTCTPASTGWTAYALRLPLGDVPQ